MTHRRRREVAGGLVVGAHGRARSYGSQLQDLSSNDYLPTLLEPRATEMRQ